jgi:hypothetical protein
MAAHADCAKQRGSKEANGVRPRPRLTASKWTRRAPGFHELVVKDWEVAVSRIDGTRCWAWRVVDENAADWWRTILRGVCLSLPEAKRAAADAYDAMAGMPGQTRLCGNAR